MKLLKNSFFRICAFLGILFASSIPVAAQGDEIYEVPGINSKKSIVRYWKGMEYIVYTEDGSTSSFSLVDYSSMSCITFTSSAFLGVNDFEIAGENVFFCGNDGTNPIFGYFNNLHLFTSATSMYYTSLGGWFPSSMSGQERITDLLKLEVLPFSPNACHVYMIGKAEFGSPSSAIQNRCIVDMCKNGTSLSYEFCQEYSSVYYYDDVLITDNNIEVVGHKNGSSGYYNTTYVKPALITDWLISYPSYTATYWYQGGNTCYATDPYRPEMAAHMFDDFYAMVSYANVCVGGIVDRGTVLSIFNSSSSCVHRYFIPQGFADTAKWAFKDLRYNPITKKLFLLQETNNSIIGSLNSVIYEFDVGAGGAISSARMFYQPNTLYFSLDQCESYRESISVGETTPIRFWHHQTGDNCVKKNDLPFVSMPNVNDHNPYGQYPRFFQSSPASLNGRLEQYEIIKICE